MITTPQQQRRRQIVMLLTVAVCLFYLSYRATTFNLVTVYSSFASIGLYICEAYGVLVMFLFFVQAWDTTEPPQQPELKNRTVDIFVPTYNEDPAILRATLEACGRITYPHRTYLCDDGGTEQRINDPEKGPAARQRAEELKQICSEVGAIYRTRIKNEHAKAGNLNYAFERTDGEFIIIFDADHVPEPQFISRLIGYFADPKLGFIQTPHAFYNFDNFQAVLDHRKRVYWEEGQLFYNVIQPGRNHWDCPIFAGSAAMFRRKAMADVGYIATETITEDMHTGMRMNARGWKSMAVADRMVAGQAAPDVTTFHTQRLRWGEGNLSIMAYDNPLTMSGLTLPQRLCYFGSMVHWAGGVFKLGIYLTPILMLFTGVPPVAEFTVTLGIITLIYMLVSIYSVSYISYGYSSFLNGELFCMINFWTSIQATWKATFMRKFQSFIVTSKRGRQSKSIWPYIRPQVLLLVVSVLALCWGWEKIVVGISDDWKKPLIPSLWVLFHMALALSVVRRGFLPEEKRYSFRHNVHLAVGYSSVHDGQDSFSGVLANQVSAPRMAAVAGDFGSFFHDDDAVSYSQEPRSTPISTIVARQDERLAVTLDLSEMGLSMVTFEPLVVGRQLEITVFGPNDEIHCRAEVRSVKPLAPSGPRTGSGGFRVGVQFEELLPQQFDAISRITMHYAVPRLYEEYSGHASMSPIRQAIREFGEARQLTPPARIYDHKLPVELICESDCSTVHGVTEEMTQDLIAVVVPEEMPMQEVWRLRMGTPLGEVRGHGEVIARFPLTFAARRYRAVVLRLIDVEGAGRANLVALTTPADVAPLLSVISPGRGRLRANLRHLVPAAVAIMTPLVLLSLTLFRFEYKDDMFLRQVIASSGEIDEETTARIEAIFNETLKQAYPSTDRLVLLMSVSKKLDRPIQLEEITRELASRDRSNVDLQIALAQVLDDMGEHAEAEKVFERLLVLADQGRIHGITKQLLILSAARASVHAGDQATARQRYEALLALTNTAVLREEYAGALIGMGHPEEARTVLGEVPETDLSGRVMLAATYLAEKDYDTAESLVRRVLLRSPDDDKGRRLLADLLVARKQYSAAMAIYTQLLEKNEKQPELWTRTAQIALEMKDYDDALTRFRRAWKLNSRTRAEQTGFLDAAAMAPHLGLDDRKIADEMFAKAIAPDAKDDPVYLARLAWVLQRTGNHEASADLLRRLLNLEPEDDMVRQQLVGVLIASERWKEAIRMLEAAGKQAEAAELQISLHLRDNDLGAAEQAARRLLALRPNDPAAVRRLADILSWQRKYAESLALFDRVLAAKPDDTEAALRAAEVTLWSGEYAAAANRFERLLSSDFEQPKLWPMFIDAASGTATLSAPQVQLAARIARQELTKGRDPLIFSRLAWVLLKADDKALANQLLDRAVALKPTDPVARKELAGVLAVAERTNEAMAMLAGLELKGRDRLRLASIYASSRQFAKAEEEARAVLDEYPDDTDALRLLGDVLVGLGKFPEAFTVYEKLQKLLPDDVTVRVRLAQVSLWRENYADATRRYTQLLSADPDQPTLWGGFIDAAASAPDDSITAPVRNVVLAIWERAAEERKTDAVLLARLAWVLRRLGQVADGVQLLRRAIKLDPNSADLHLQLAQSLDAEGKFDEANQHYQSVLRLKALDRSRKSLPRPNSVRPTVPSPSPR